MAMEEYIVQADIQLAIKSTYKTNKSRVSTNIGSGEWFTTESGVRQGSIYIVRNLHGLGDQGRTSNNPDNDLELA